MEWSDHQKGLIKRMKGMGAAEAQKQMPPEERQWKCPVCHSIVDSEPCPKCGNETMHPMCPLDHCHCGHENEEGLDYCPICDHAICPRCGSHDVVQISRITGYLNEVSGWNQGKAQELKDRTRYNVLTGEQCKLKDFQQVHP